MNQTIERKEHIYKVSHEERITCDTSRSSSKELTPQDKNFISQKGTSSFKADRESRTRYMNKYATIEIVDKGITVHTIGRTDEITQDKDLRLFVRDRR